MSQTALRFLVDVNVGQVEGILAQHADKLAGHFCVYQRGRLRVRI